MVVRGYTVISGYFGNPEATEEAIDADGWLHTGDVGVMDEDGNLRITDRTKDMYVVGGFNAYPAEVESMLARHPGVGQVAVVGVPDERLGEVGCAFVVPRPGVDTAPLPEQIIAWAKDEMANYKVPRQVQDHRSTPAERERQGTEDRAQEAGARRRNRRQSPSPTGGRDSRCEASSSPAAMPRSPTSSR